VNATVLRPIRVDVNTSTDAEQASMLQCDTLASHALGNLTLRLAPPVYQKVEQMDTPDVWVELQCLYCGTLTQLGQ
jgi:hypothetical protein